MAAALGAIVFITRLRTLAHRVGSFECALRTSATSGWASGIAHYAVDRLVWYRVISVNLGPSASWPRARLVITSWERRMSADGPTDIVEAHCRVDEREFVLAMHRAAFSGLTSWLEATPPGDRLSQVL
ncbi:DUF2550 domain-containing protein [Beutenbergia cavernae]|uniref:DUF2550 domain-containing protein n=1 Tax=Beutenbergia cavernae TaxID=84757 RepID=UPI0002D54E12|nr:DUF2550 domain-containing protein [Beutenbergia cavernae]